MKGIRTRMKKTLFGDTINPACVYCACGRLAPDNIMILCSRFGPVAPQYKCKHYVYDPIKRVPRRQPKLPDYSPDDFKLS